MDKRLISRFSTQFRLFDYHQKMRNDENLENCCSEKWKLHGETSENFSCACVSVKDVEIPHEIQNAEEEWREKVENFPASISYFLNFLIFPCCEKKMLTTRKKSFRLSYAENCELVTSETRTERAHFERNVKICSFTLDTFQHFLPLCSV